MVDFCRLARISHRTSLRGAARRHAAKARAEFPAGLCEDTLPYGNSSATQAVWAAASRSRWTGENCGLGKKGEESLSLGVVHRRSIFADFVGFRMPDGTSMRLAVGGDQLGAVACGDLTPLFFEKGAEPGFAFGFAFGDIVQTAVVSQPFVGLRGVAVAHLEDSVHLRIDVDDDVALERGGLCESVGHVGYDGIPAQGGDLRNDGRNGDHVGSVLNGDADGAMIGMVVVGAVREYKVGLATAHFGDDRPA